MMMRRVACVLTILLETTWVYGLPEGFDVALGKEDLAAAKEQTMESLGPLKPGKDKVQKPQLQQNTLWGNLFGDGRLFALMPLLNLKATTAFAEWQRDHWEFRDAWKLDEGWGPADSDQRPFAEPFKLKDLNGDGVPELLAAYDHDKYGSSCAIGVYSKSKGTLEWLDAASYMMEPEMRGGYLVVFNASRRKAWWTQESFYQWKGNTLEWKASWGEDTQDINIKGGEGDIIYTATVPGAKPGTKEKFVWDGLDVKCDDQRVGTTRFTHHPPKSDKLGIYEPGCADADVLWFFEAITGLPWNIAGENATNGKPPAEVKKFQKFVTVEVTGDPVLVKRLEPAVKKLTGKAGK